VGGCLYFFVVGEREVYCIFTSEVKCFCIAGQSATKPRYRGASLVPYLLFLHTFSSFSIMGHRLAYGYSFWEELLFNEFINIAADYDDEVTILRSLCIGFLVFWFDIFGLLDLHKSERIVIVRDRG
jgi:hypothetical protein